MCTSVVHPVSKAGASESRSGSRLLLSAPGQGCSSVVVVVLHVSGEEVNRSRGGNVFVG